MSASLQPELCLSGACTDEIDSNRYRKRKIGNEMERGKNPKSLANLKPPIRPGEVRNPNGINSLKCPITDHYWEVSEEVMPEGLVRRFNKKCGASLLKPGDTWARAVAVRACFEAVLSCSVRAMREVREAIEGKAPQRLEITRPARKEKTCFSQMRKSLSDRSRIADDLTAGQIFAP